MRQTICQFPLSNGHTRTYITEFRKLREEGIAFQHNLGEPIFLHNGGTGHHDILHSDTMGVWIDGSS